MECHTFGLKKNPLVGEELNYYNDIACYKSTNPNTGYLFYRGVMRGTIDHIPIVINIPKNMLKLKIRLRVIVIETRLITN